MKTPFFGTRLWLNSRSRITSSPLRRRFQHIVSIAIGLILLGQVAQATTVRRFDLGGLVQRSDRILRARVIDIKPGTVQAGGGTISTVTYRLKVIESLRGAPVGETELTMVADPKGTEQIGKPRRFALFADVPKLEKGGEYLLLATAPSRIGLCTFVGLGQGCFQVRWQDKQEFVVNGFNNAGLGLPKAGAVTYQDMVTRIRGLINK